MTTDQGAGFAGSVREGPDPKEAPATRAHFLAGDPIRGAMSLIVFSAHVALTALVITGFQFTTADYDRAFGRIGGELLGSAELAVYVFFVLSGYLIGRPFVQRFLANGRMPRFSNYSRRRLLRIFPAFWVVVTAALVVSGPEGSSLGEIVGIYGLLQIYDLTPSDFNQGTLGQMWTLQAEMGFYVLLPASAFVAARLCPARVGVRGRWAILFGALVAVAVAGLAIRHALPQHTPYTRWFPTLLFTFVPGIALAALETVIPERVAGKPHAHRWAVGLVAVGLLLCLVYAGSDHRSEAIKGTFAALGTGALVGALLLHQWSGARPWRILVNRPFQWLGECSLSIYLLHVPILWELHPHLESLDNPKVAFLVIFAIAFPISVALGRLSYIFIERPCLELDRWPWQRRRPEAKAAAEAPLEPVAEPALLPER